MKKTILLFFVLSCIKISAQNSTQKNYIGGEVYMIAEDQNTGKKSFEKPFGKVQSIVYDTFFKNLTIIVELENGKTMFKLTYIKDVKDSEMTLMQDEKGQGNFSVLNKLDELGKLILIRTEYVQGQMIVLRFENVTKN